MRWSASIAFALAALCATPSLADPVEDFYKGKQLRFVIRAAPGGNDDLYMRLLARYMVRYLPGHPEAIPVNMPGGGGLTALNYTQPPDCRSSKSACGAYQGAQGGIPCSDQ